jgi:hypothetical protein
MSTHTHIYLPLGDLARLARRELDPAFRRQITQVLRRRRYLMKSRHGKPHPDDGPRRRTWSMEEEER